MRRLAAPPTHPAQLIPGRWVWAGLLLAGAMLMGAAAPALGALATGPAGSARDAQGTDPLRIVASTAPQAPNVALAAVPVAAPAAPLSASSPAQPLRWVYMVGAKMPPSLREHASQIDVLSPAWYRTDADGMLSGSGSDEITQFAKARGIKVIPVVANGEFSALAAHSLLSDGDRQTQLLDSLQWLLNTYGYEGVNIDFENVASADRTLLSAMMSNIYARLHPLGKLVTIALPSKTSERYSGFPGAFDYAGLAPNFDLGLLMAYDQHYAGGPAGPIADVAWVNDVVSYAKANIPAKKLLLGVPFYGYNWAIGRDGARSMPYSDVESMVLGTGAQIQMDQASQSPFFTSSGRIVWFENSDSLKAKLNLVGVHGLAGWGGWRLGQEDPNFWKVTLGR